jgi:hypothetical protein
VRLSGGASVMNEYVSPAEPSNHAGHMPARREGLRACLVSRKPIESFNLPPVDHAEGVMIEAIPSLEDATRLLASRRSGWNLALIDIDDFAETGTYIDHLRRLRSRAPNLPLILLSCGFRRDDLGQERLAIGDVSLISPVTPAVWGEALTAALQNNMAWRKRRRALLVEKTRLIA